MKIKMKDLVMPLIFIGIMIFLVALPSTKRVPEYNIEIYTLHDIFYIDGLKVTSETGFDYHFRNMKKLNDFISSETLRAVKDCLDGFYYYEDEEELTTLKF